MKRNDRIDSLDAIRGVSILAIVSYHVIQRWPVEVNPLIRQVSGYGQYGVDLFFALSGLLVGVSTATAIAQRSSHCDLRRLLSRLARIYVPYLAALIIAYVGVRVFRGEGFNPIFLVLFQNYLREIPFFLVSWFLCILIPFYILAYFLPRIKRVSTRSWSCIFAIMAISCVAQRCFLVASGSVQENAPFGFFFTATHLRADSIALAFAIGLVIKQSSIINNFTALTGFAAYALIILLAIPLVLTSYMPFEKAYIFSPLFAAVFSTFLVSWTYLCKESKGVATQIFARFSAVTFSLYLTHSFAIEATLKITNIISLSQPLVFVLMILVMATLGTLFFVLVELPSKRLADLIRKP